MGTDGISRLNRGGGVGKSSAGGRGFDSHPLHSLAALTARRLAPQARIVEATERVATEGKLLTLESGMTLVVMTDVAGRSRLEKLLKGARSSRT